MSDLESLPNIEYGNQEIIKRRLLNVDNRVEELLSQSIPESLRDSPSKIAVYADHDWQILLELESQHVPQSKYQQSTDIRIVKMHKYVWHDDQPYKRLPPEKSEPCLLFGWYKSQDDGVHGFWESSYHDEHRYPVDVLAEIEEILKGTFEPIAHQDILQKRSFQQNQNN